MNKRDALLSPDGANAPLTKQEAQTLVLEVVDLVQPATDDSKSVFIADTLCRNLEEFAGKLGR